MARCSTAAGSGLVLVWDLASCVVAGGLRLDGPGKCSYLTELSFIVNVSVSQNVEEVCVL